MEPTYVYVVAGIFLFCVAVGLFFVSIIRALRSFGMKMNEFADPEKSFERRLHLAAKVREQIGGALWHLAQTLKQVKQNHGDVSFTCTDDAGRTLGDGGAEEVESVAQKILSSKGQLVLRMKLKVETARNRDVIKEGETKRVREILGELARLRFADLILGNPSEVSFHIKARVRG